VEFLAASRVRLMRVGFSISRLIFLYAQKILQFEGLPCRK
jgi:hypothetical protein